MKAIWNGQTIAESNETVMVESNHYFPPNSVQMGLLKKSSKQYTCPWKGMCDYYDIMINGKTNSEAAWMYPEPKEAAENIKGYFAFWKGLKL